MSEPLARLYDLALRTLDDHERRIDALRGRLGPTLAAAALGVTLLSGPLVGGAHPGTVAGTLALVVAVGGLAVTVGAAFRILLTRHRTETDLDPRDLLNDLTEHGLLNDESRFYEAMIMRFDEAMNRDDRMIQRLTTAFTAMLCGILLMLCGLALAALVG